MRVIGGRLGGRVLLAPRGRATRPTPERVREAVFSILGSVEGERVLDLFAGSGALGVEALSRGAAGVTFIDASASAVAAIRRNLEELGLTGEVRRQTASSYLRLAREHGRQYDLVFLDPPYGQAATVGRPLSMALAPVLKSNARVVAESDRREPLDLAPLTLVDSRRYGDTMIRFYGP